MWMQVHIHKTVSFLQIQAATPFLLRFIVYIVMLFLLIPTILKNFGKTFYDEIYESDTKFPQLFIYSTGDEIIDYKGFYFVQRAANPTAGLPLSQPSI